MDKKLKIGVFGGYRGQTMINVLLMHPDAELVAVCDKYKPVLDKIAEKAKENNQEVALYESFEDFEKHDMDAVVLANYANEHASYAIRLLKAGKHVLSEVLPCETMAQAVELIEAAEESGKVYAYAENYCYMAHTFEMWKRYEKGEIGEVMYGEGEYVHDCGSIWPKITYGDKNHWRNRLFSTFYCTHSIGPLFTISGQRPVSVTGFETRPAQWMVDLGSKSSSPGAIIIIATENGAIFKSLHGSLKREPGSVNYEIYGDKGMMESDRWDGKKLSAYLEGEKLCEGEVTHYEPEKFVSPELAAKFSGHGGSDFYATHFFIEKILGTEEGKKYSIDVYRAVDMGICGILAYRSILNGNIPVKVPNLRNKAERDQYRNDHACTTPEVAGDQLLPAYHTGDLQVPEGAYEKVKNLFEEGKKAE